MRERKRDVELVVGRGRRKEEGMRNKYCVSKK